MRHPFRVFIILLLACPALYLTASGQTAVVEPSASAATGSADAARRPPATTALESPGRLALHQQPYAEEEDRTALLDYYYVLIKDLPFDYGNIGSIVEALAFLELQEIYARDQYEVIRSLEYQDLKGATAGELDLVVLDRATGESVIVAEVKLTRNFYRAGEKARNQLFRFRSHVAAGAISRFIYNDDRDRNFRPDQFSNAARYVRIGNRGALEAGFDYEIDLGREEADELQARLLGLPQIVAPEF